MSGVAMLRWRLWWSSRSSKPLPCKVAFLFFLCIRLFPWHTIFQLACCAESLAWVERERDDAVRHSSELEKKLDSADANARTLAEAAAKSKEEAAKVCEKEMAQRLGAVANSLSGKYLLPRSFLENFSSLLFAELFSVTLELRVPGYPCEFQWEGHPS